MGLNLPSWAEILWSNCSLGQTSSLSAILLPLFLWTNQILYFCRDFHLYKCRNGWLRSREASRPQAPCASLLSNMPRIWTLCQDIGKSSIHKTFTRVLQLCSTLIMAPNGGQKWWSSNKKYWDIWRYEQWGKTEREVGLLSLKTCNPKNIEGGLPPEAINCIMMGIDLIAPRNFQWQKSHIIPQVLSLGSSALMAGNFLLNSSLILPAILPCPYY